MTKTVLTILISLLSILGFAQSKETIKYVALGDSYTICEGINTSECWPTILVKHLVKEGIEITLEANPSKTGYTSQDLIDSELPILAESEANFVTILIGVNDWVKGVNEGIFRSNLTYILETVTDQVGSSKRVLLLTIPDFSATPEGKKYSNRRDISQGIAHFNSIIVETAEYYGVKVVDLYATSQQMKGNPELIANDGLHPSAKEYAIWEKLIYDEVVKLLTSK